MKAMKKVLKKEKKQAPILLKPEFCFLDVVIVKKAQKWVVRQVKYSQPM